MTRTDILNAIARTIGAKTYCEIGVRNPADNFDRIEVATKIGVDPVPARSDILRATSDQYFASCPKWADLYFIDGLHTDYQSARDFGNAALCLHPGGVIVLHDCLPRSLAAMAPVKPLGGGPWNGTVWKTWLAIRGFHAWESYCIPDDHGCGVAWRAKNSALGNPVLPDDATFLANAVNLVRAAHLPAVLAALEARP